MSKIILNFEEEIDFDLVTEDLTEYFADDFDDYIELTDFLDITPKRYFK